MLVQRMRKFVRKNIRHGVEAVQLSFRPVEFTHKLPDETVELYDLELRKNVDDLVAQLVCKKVRLECTSTYYGSGIEHTEITVTCERV